MSSSLTAMDFPAIAPEDGAPTLNTSLFPVQPVGVHGVRLPVRGRRQ